MTQADEQVWYRLEILTSNSEAMSGHLWSNGALGVEVQDHDTYMEDGSIAPVPDGVARLIAFFDDPYPTDELPEAVTLVSHARYDDRSWETAWKRFFRPVRVSKRVIVGPPWEDFEAPEGGLKIEIEPGMAFGTGTHETTGVCAELLDELIAAHTPQSVLDVGCGTGVLAMMAAGFDVPRVDGVDIDPTAVGVATENLARNGLAGTVQFSTTALPQLGTYDLVVANILAHILRDLKDGLIARVRSDGHLITSGITTDQAEDFENYFRDEGLELIERRDLGEWVALVWRRR